MVSDPFTPRSLQRGSASAPADQILEFDVEYAVGEVDLRHGIKAQRRPVGPGPLHVERHPEAIAVGRGTPSKPLGEATGVRGKARVERDQLEGPGDRPGEVQPSLRVYRLGEHTVVGDSHGGGVTGAGVDV